MDTIKPLIGEVCSLVSSIPNTTISWIWFWISYLLTSYWYYIVPTIILWTVYQIFTRWAHHYNSDNGFTPAFNSFVGGGVFFVFEFIINWLLMFILGSIASCGLLWTNLFYLIPFVATGMFLHGIGFWPYMMLPIINVKIDLFGRRTRW